MPNKALDWLTLFGCGVDNFVYTTSIDVESTASDLLLEKINKILILL